MKNSPEPAEEPPLWVVEPHGCAPLGEKEEGCLAVNLGGIAEDVFRPMVWAVTSFFFFGIVHEGFA